MLFLVFDLAHETLVTCWPADQIALGDVAFERAQRIEDVLDTLRSLKCDVAQGYLIGRPTSHQGLMRQVKDQKRYRIAI